MQKATQMIKKRERERERERLLVYYMIWNR